MTISVIGLVSAGLVLIGPAKVATHWISRVVFWVAVVAVGLAIWLLSDPARPPASGCPSRPARSGSGSTAVLALGILWFPLVGDVSRFATDESVAASGTALGFGSTAVIGVVWSVEPRRSSAQDRPTSPPASPRRCPASPG